MYEWKEVHNNDNGSLFTGTRLSVGDKIQIRGEQRTRTVTHVMGSAKKGWRACFNGQGAVPQGNTAWRPIHLQENELDNIRTNKDGRTHEPAERTPEDEVGAISNSLERDSIRVDDSQPTHIEQRRDVGRADRWAVNVGAMKKVLILAAILPVAVASTAVTVVAVRKVIKRVWIWI